MQLPTEGYNPSNGVWGYVKDIQPLNAKVRQVYAFTALTNPSEKGTGKVWRRAVYFWDDSLGQWAFLTDIRKSTTWRGPAYKVTFWPHNTRGQGKWVESWFRDEADAEEFLLANWEFFV